MSSTKNPDDEAENPAPMPPTSSHEGHKAKMVPRPDAPPGLEQDGCGNVIPLSQRTKEDQEKALSGRKDS
ncbi:MAG: hypothetical protein RL274_1935 [Pseudomonadota bacterium]|jgi:hypothetical protein